MATRFDTIWLDARLATMVGDGLGVIEAGAVGAINGRIAFCGPMADLPTGWDAARRIGCDGRWITPGLIDCHTHLVHAGNRAHEFELRLEGASYEEIARAGGGIASTVRATRTADHARLTAETMPRLDALLAEGVTTVEVKSGYGLDLASEIKQLRVARGLARERLVRVRTSCLAAHAVPQEFATNRAGYLAVVRGQILPAVARIGFADAVDGFCERIAFSVDEIAGVFETAQSLGLPVKLHADQLSNGGGAALAARFGALSADHLEYTDASGVAAMVRAGTVAVLLPGAFYTLREAQVPPVMLLRQAGVPMALATDCNPGTSPLTSLLLTLNLAATLYRMTVSECLRGVTVAAAQALGLGGEVGRLAPGLACDLALWSVERPAELVYRLGFNPLHARVFAGDPCPI
jgi:imidazolonepropionase